jgi:predicted DNA-binding ribbon-helix-helix protein
MDTRVYTRGRSLIVKHSVIVIGHKTSISLEKPFWDGVKGIASERDMTLSDLISKVENERTHGNLSSALRLFVLDHYKVLAERGMIAA